MLVIGCPGAGKSTLATALAHRTGLPLIHLDQEYWSEGWTPTPKQAWIERLKELCGEPKWIHDGNYSGSIPGRLPFADTVIVVDRPRWRCIFNVLRRTLSSLGKVRPDMAAGCPERFNLEFLGFIWGYQARFETRIRPLLDDATSRGTRVITVRSADEMLARIDVDAEHNKLAEHHRFPLAATDNTRADTP